MYCYFGLCQYLYEKAIVNGAGWIGEEDFDKLCAPIKKNDEVVPTYAVGVFMPDGKHFVVADTYKDRHEAAQKVRYMNGG